MKFKVTASLIFLALFSIRLWKPEIKIDSLSVILVVLAMAPWLIQYIKSLEINGIGKVDLITKDQKDAIEKNAEEIGITSNSNEEIKNDYSFYNLRYEDPKLALAGLRIELESTLTKLMRANNLQNNSSFSGVSKMTHILSKNEIISNGEYVLIRDITGILNSAVHGQLDNYDSQNFDWVFSIGLKLLASLNEKLNE
ncbi:TPA: hypothetical protein LWN96_002739 [Listeria monocytogenes]|uniref:DUF4145 domain-containing protein n=2 Tax=Listeria monocytogenes TaxID=1639 RepID=A0AB74NEA0_LISMN|nr:hypothetical protein [Listeria monocytogenes]ALU76588.1 hypothetical protein AUZ27_02035 [Listeria monocytogenes]EAA0012484.1 hypothetical protein [Listeria monocytogenes]EAA0018628.1 hypothetical protein [Listeria monocytogenes]EAA0022214.1 hypothetical protein [Listeria monocytogenes]EAA0047298.1 hypothetical protein [Listeria monocytogenes]